MPTLPPYLSDDDFQWKLWIYTNYDCNLRCSYCVAQSTPNAPRRAIGLDTVRQLIDEAVEQGFSSVFFTGGEPLILDDIYAMLSYSSQRLPTILLTNAMLLKGNRIERLKAVAHERLVIQVSLDGGLAEPHDTYRGAGSWIRTVEGIKILQQNGFNVRLSTTETPANLAHIKELCAFHTALGIPEEDHFIRPLAKRGFSTEGLEVGIESLSPEITANVDGIYWHPLATDQDMLVSPHHFPLTQAVKMVQKQLEAHARGEKGPLRCFT